MANWKYKIDLNKVISEMSDKHDLSYVEEDCPQEVKDAIAGEIRKAEPISYLAGRILNCKSIAAVNRALGRVFEEADRRLVWCGF